MDKNKTEVRATLSSIDYDACASAFTCALLFLKGGAFMTDDDDLGIEGTSPFTDADWAAINKLKRAYDSKGMRGLNDEFDELIEDDPVRAFRVMRVFFPWRMREALDEAIASMGADLKEILRQLDPPLTKH
jgi:hypothetical protein